MFTYLCVFLKSITAPDGWTIYNVCRPIDIQMKQKVLTKTFRMILYVSMVYTQIFQRLKN